MYTKTGSSVTRSFCTTCGSRMFNYLARDSDWVGFFPATLEEDLQKDLPIAFRATAHHLGEEAVLDISQLVLHVPEG